MLVTTNVPGLEDFVFIVNNAHQGAAMIRSLPDGYQAEFHYPYLESVAWHGASGPITRDEWGSVVTKEALIRGMCNVNGVE